MISEPGKPPLVLHLIYNLALGGLETGLVNLINRMPAERYRHAIACLTIADDFSRRLERTDVPVIALERRNRKVDLRVYQRLRRVFAELRPAILHTRNLPALDAQLFAAMAHVPVRIHGEHGRVT